MGMIELDSEFAKTIGFTSDKFEGYLWYKDDIIIVSFIRSKKKGNCKPFIEALREKYIIHIPTPSNIMKIIGKKLKLRLTTIYDSDFGDDCEILTNQYVTR